MDLGVANSMQYGAIAVSVIWFIVRLVLHFPADVPLFSGDTFMFGDILAVLLGIAGLYGIVKDFIF